jgi:hypothetical protein
VVLPDASGPNISTTLPRGTPPTPKAKSKAIEPVEIIGTATPKDSVPNLIIDPLPNCLSICETAASKAFFFSGNISAIISSNVLAKYYLIF